MKSQSINFSEIVEKIYDMPLEDKVELKNLLEHNISELRRKEIADNAKISKSEYRSGKMKFSSKMNELKKLV
jgi:tRNA(Ser,Leu) C12 N-acetylase TAN1